MQAILLGFRAYQAYFVGVSITSTPWPVVLTDMQGNVLSECEIPSSNHPGNVTTSIHRVMTGLLRKTGVSRDQVFGIGIAVIGVIDQTEVMCRYSSALNCREGT